ncbi:MAG: dihydroorotate dehydrogenase (quinone) [Rhodospirillales bacterium]|nr:dihydroorotate dehydrogenase (quinone) [Rhodospirillales bacterium]
MMIGFYDIVGPFVRLLKQKKARSLAIKGLKWGLVPRPTLFNDPILETTLWGLKFRTPIGLAAGFDKNAEVPGQLLAQGFGSVEIGSIDSKTAEVVATRLIRRKKSYSHPGIIGINILKDKLSNDAIAEYIHCSKAIAQCADYMVINISSPLVPELKAYRQQDKLADLLSQTRSALNENTPPLLLKVAPDLSDEEKKGIAAVITKQKVDGLIVVGPKKTENVGFTSTELVAQMYTLTEGKTPIIAVRGITSGQDAYERIKAGASLVQFYAAMVTKGPAHANRLAIELAELLKRDGYTNVSEAVGADHNK